jgi:peptidyl-prolyl cis-trans isomerase C
VYFFLLFFSSFSPLSPPYLLPLIFIHISLLSTATKNMSTSSGLVLLSSHTQTTTTSAQKQRKKIISSIFKAKKNKNNHAWRRRVGPVFAFAKESSVEVEYAPASSSTSTSSSFSSSSLKNAGVKIGSLAASFITCLDAHAATAQSSNPEMIAEVAEAASALATYSVIGLTVAAIGVSLFKSFGSFVLPGPRASASHILVADESLAVSLKERLLEGPQSTLLDRFAKEASAYSTCPSKSKGGDLGEFKPGQMVKEFDTVVFEAPLMELQGPVKTQFGYHLILVTDRNEPSA